MKDLAIDVVQLSLQFGDEEPIFEDLSFQVEKGEFVMIIGPNGSGKTSLIKAIMGLYKPANGHAHLYETSIGYVPQYLQKDPYSPMTVRELLSIKLDKINFWWGYKKREKQMLKQLKRTNIAHIIDRQVKNLSGGEFQRLMIAYALIGEPGLLILDEPVSGIDIQGEKEFFELIEGIHQELNLTILMISHDLDVVYRYATNVICLNKSLLCYGEPLDVLTKETIEKTFSTKRGIYHHHHKEGKPKVKKKSKTRHH